MSARCFLFSNKAMCFVAAVTTLFSAAPALAEVRIVTLGDSNFRNHLLANQGYPAQLEAALRARGHQVTVTNQGIPGDTTTGILGRQDSAVPPGTDIVVLWVGDNDRKRFAVSLDTVTANKRTIRERLYAKGVEVYTVLNGQQGINDRADLHQESSRPDFSRGYHLNAAGNAIVVRRTLPAIETPVRKAEKQGACRPQCWNQPIPPNRVALTR
jgi:hypothetical protein